MSDFTQLKCEACQAGAPPATDDERADFLNDHPDWEVAEVDGVPHLRRTFKFSNFVAALDFTNRIGALAEAENHHPALLTEWGKSTVTWWTHKIKDLHLNDLIAASKTDAIYEASSE
jgi:4a-hydroxytetrahydrobiopterin dehydratase